ncbi:ABC transporter substrate-binding protein [Bradyrhizobium liaoningense]|nr:ABC transporter substrate-binding protein [Bradyrhizobium liaoningense]
MAMQRRHFITLVSGAAAAWPLAGRAQQARRQHRIALVHSGIPADQLTETAGPFWVRRFYQTLRKLGYAEGSNIVVQRYSAEGRSQHFTSLAAAVVGSDPQVIVVNLNELIEAFAAATTTIPIVAIMGDPIATGLVANLAHPGGNLTGVSIDAGYEIVAKRLQILKEAMPSAAKVAYLTSSRTLMDTPLGLSLQKAGQALGIVLSWNFLPEVNDEQLRRTFAELTSQRFDAAMVDASGSFLARRASITELAGKLHLPIIYPFRDYADSGGLISYAPDLGELAERLAVDVHQVLNGTRPGDIPIYRPSKFHLVINLKAASALSLEMPPTLLARADEVIE